TVAERFADDAATAEALACAGARLDQELNALEGPWRALRGDKRDAERPRYEALALAAQICCREVPKGAYYASSNACLAAGASHPPGVAFYAAPFLETAAAQGRVQAALLRCVFGPLPFRPVQVQPSWESPEVVALATATYEERLWGNLPLLGIALQQAS